MGLDISVYEELTPLPEHERGDNCHYGGGNRHVWLYQDPNTPESRHAGVDVGRCYSSERPEFHFRAGSYNGYNWWRDQLSRMAHGLSDQEFWDLPEGDARKHGDFAELIDFPDNEGTIGPVVAAKLYQDFMRNREKARKWANQLESFDGRHWAAKYEDWTTAFRIAANRGAVQLH